MVYDLYEEELKYLQMESQRESVCRHAHENPGELFPTKAERDIYNAAVELEMQQNRDNDILMHQLRTGELTEAWFQRQAKMMGEIALCEHRLAREKREREEERKQQRDRQRPLSVAEVLARPAPKFLIEKWLVQGTVAQLFADQSTGKTFVALDWACHIASGTDWHGLKVKQGPVMYVAAEGVSKKRMVAWIQEHPGIDTSNLHLIDAPVNLFRRDEVDSWTRRYLGEKPALIVFDTLSRCTGGAEELSNKDAGIVMSNVDRFKLMSPDVCILVLNHPGHQNKERSRGWSAWSNALDTDIRLQKRSLLEGDDALTLTCVKQKDSETPSMTVGLHAVELDDYDDEDPTSCVIVADSTEPEVAQLQIRNYEAVRLWQKSLELAAKSEDGSVRSTEWKDACVAAGICAASTFSNDKHLKRVLELGLVTKTGEGKSIRYWPRQKDELE